MRTHVWFYPSTRTGAQIAASAQRQLRLWETELTTEQATRLAVVIEALRGFIIAHNRFIHISPVTMPLTDAVRCEACSGRVPRNSNWFSRMCRAVRRVGGCLR